MPRLENFRHELFCHEYLKDENGARAYAEAGYHVKTWKDGSNSAAVGASQLLRHVKVKARLEELRARTVAKLEVSRERVLNELGRLAFSDVRKIHTRAGLKPPDEWDDETAAAVAGVETEKLFEKDERGKKIHIGYTSKVKLWDKNQALLNLAKHFKLLEPESSGNTYNTQFIFCIPNNSRDNGILVEQAATVEALANGQGAGGAAGGENDPHS